MDINVRIPAIEKLVDYTASGIGSVAGSMLAPWQARRNAYALRIQAQGDADALRIQAQGDADAMTIIANAQAESRQVLLRRDSVVRGEIDFSGIVSHRIRYHEGKRPRNIISIIGQAAEERGDGSKEVYENGIRPAIEATGYTPSRIDQEAFVGKIGDEIIAQIRRSRFLVADVTHGEDGARGGVYYEAGFAHGLGLQVIFTCRKDLIDKVPFATRQFNHIVWENSDDLRVKLSNRIGSVLGDGPNAKR